MKRLTPAEQVTELLVRVEEHRGEERWRGWVELADSHLTNGPCRDPFLCPFCLVGRQPKPTRAEQLAGFEPDRIELLAEDPQ